MLTDDPQKREINNKRHFSFRLNLFFFIVFGLFSVLIIQLAILQFVEGPTLSAAGSKKSTRNVKIAPIRGNIYDSEGKAIAYSTSTQSLYFSIPPNYKTADLEKMAREEAANLVEIFDKYGDPELKMTVDDVIKQMDLGFKLNNISTPRRIKSGLTNDEIAYFLGNRSKFVGIDIMEESVRHYSQDTTAVQLVGYLKKFKGGVRENFSFYADKAKETEPELQYLEDEEVGVDGLEMLYQDALRGKNGLKSYPVNNQEVIVGPVQITNPQKGDDLYLTINRGVQQTTEQAITDQIKKISTSSLSAERASYAKIGFAVAIEVDTGKVIAMASMPDYDPNIWSGGRINQEDYDNIKNVVNNGTITEVYPKYDSDEERAKHPSSLVPLGSTMKPLSVLIGLNEGLFKTTDVYNDTGVFKFGKAGHEVPIINAGGHVYGALDPARAIEKSSNPFMAAMVGSRLNQKYPGAEGVDIWDKYMKEFGLGVSTESGLYMEKKGVVDYYHELETASAQSALIRASFGQQARYTTLQLAVYASMLANHGKRLKPQFVNEIKDSAGNVVQSFTPEVLNTVDFPEEYWKEIETGMGKVGVQGFDGVSYTFNRKTGTAQSDVKGRRADNGIFIAYAPADKPKLAVAVVMPDGGFGGWSAAPVARKIFDAYDYEVGLNGTPGKAKDVAASTETDAAGTETTVQ
ncbi:peptidoglycan D,D-transpeptidase FtsI family protein [Paenibacillus sp. Leaf72]|uniref:peptidoglycan D,D-transpeptidase FtsI family protein n=1 Tax=Paenibacillus sp. Leaf72 TaxID=1736234 RepID=UPI0006FA163F|nr:penicillin-binding transpeptidase domain-containing protein [Paenibacillus sp. Leaf72]KQO01062.1 cell division protein FtsI [Paenibacillus sp. Leaf72]